MELKVLELTMEYNLVKKFMKCYDIHGICYKFSSHEIPSKK